MAFKILENPFDYRVETKHFVKCHGCNKEFSSDISPEVLTRHLWERGWRPVDLSKGWVYHNIIRTFCPDCIKKNEKGGE